MGFRQEYHRIYCPKFVTSNETLHGNRNKELSRSMTEPTKWPVRPAKTKISLGIRPIRLASSLSAWRKLGSKATHKAHSEDSDRTGLMPRLIWVFNRRRCHFVRFVMLWLHYNLHERYVSYSCRHSSFNACQATRNMVKFHLNHFYDIRYC